VFLKEFPADLPGAGDRSPIIENFMARCCIGLLFFLTAQHVLTGQVLLAGLVVALQMMLVADVRAARRAQQLPVPVPVVLGAVLVCVLAAVLVSGSHGAAWAFPALVGTNLAQTRRSGTVVSVLLTLSVPGVVLTQSGAEVALTLFLALSLTGGFMWFSSNLTGKMQSRLLAASTRDPLTGCLNRRVLSWKARQLHANRSVLLLIDIDHFKAVNDEYGHTRGDQVLKSVAALIRSELREGDSLFRLGGEEFLVLLEGSTSALSAHVAERIRSRIAATNFLGERKVTVSIGIAELAAQGSLSEALRLADEGLYAAKAEGRNRVGAATGTNPVGAAE
jgi:diguanylate cyclase (GGDEF)-like protein